MRPHVICHMCTTIDGKILVDRWGKLPGGRSGAGLFERTAASLGVRAWLVGTTTMREFMGRNLPLKPAAHVPRSDHLAAPLAKSFAIGVDRKGVLRFQHADVEGDHVVLLVSEKVTDRYLAHLQAAGVSHLFCGQDQVDLPLALEKLRRLLGIKTLLLEGGGTFNGAMLKQGLVDEISQVIVPVLDGGGKEVTGVFDPPDGAPKRAAASLRLRSHRRLPGGVSWFRYRVVPRR